MELHPLPQGQEEADLKIWNFPLCIFPFKNNGDIALVVMLVTFSPWNFNILTKHTCYSLVNP